MDRNEIDSKVIAILRARGPVRHQADRIMTEVILALLPEQGQDNDLEWVAWHIETQSAVAAFAYSDQCQNWINEIYRGKCERRHRSELPPPPSPATQETREEGERRLEDALDSISMVRSLQVKCNTYAEEREKDKAEIARLAGEVEAMRNTDWDGLAFEFYSLDGAPSVFDPGGYGRAMLAKFLREKFKEPTP